MAHVKNLIFDGKLSLQRNGNELFHSFCEYFFVAAATAFCRSHSLTRNFTT